MPKPITEWGDEEVEAMFGGLPDGSVILRRGDSLTVANVRNVESDSSYGEYFYSPYRTTNTRLILELETGDGNYAVQRIMPRRINADERDVKEMREHIQKVTEQAKKIGLF